MNHNLTDKYKRCSAFASKISPSSAFSRLASGIRCLASWLYPPSSPVCPPSDQGCRLASGVRRQASGVCLQSAFTLIELLVVIVVIAILMGITIPVSKYAIYRAKMARQEVMLAKIRSALDDYRATYGEYPITPITNGPSNRSEAIKHYWDRVRPDEDTNAVTQAILFTNVDLSTNTLEMLFTYSGGIQANYYVDYSLTFPLTIRQLLEGKSPYVNFKKVTAMSQINQYERTRDRRFWEGLRKTKGGGIVKATIYYGLGDAVNRYEAIDPVSGLQWKYTCNDGVSYTITTNTF